MDKYRGYQQLLQGERQGKDFLVHIRKGTSGLTVIAPHGGGIEPGTMELADGIAGEDHTFYCFEGIKKENNFDLHISSVSFNEPVGVNIVANSKRVLALHGCGEDKDVVYLGGRDIDLKQRIGSALAKAGFNAEMNPRPEIRGENIDNICNRCQSGQGVQVEISKSLRKRMFKDLTRMGRKSTTAEFHTFVAVLRDVL
ncbi:MAG: poly-gamma-glutamate hydrolase family protein [Thermodesulfobacteriota bacterium]